jgi:membrane protein DedA with SNARE-associated domain
VNAAVLLAIVGATFVSEDLATVSTGAAVADGTLPLLPALAACAAGILTGDLGLWLAGRIGGRRVLAWRVMRRVPLGSVRALAAWADRHPAAAMLGSRCLPGTRVPLYLASGVWGERPWRLIGWMGVAVLIWTPLLMLGAITIGPSIAHPIERLFVLGSGAGVSVGSGVGSAVGAGSSWISLIARGITAFSLLALLHGVAAVARADTRARIAVRMARLRRWEFWPAWLFNAPIVAWAVFLAIKHRSLTVFTLANPGIEHGGVVGESKSDILAKLPPEWVMPWALIEPGERGEAGEAGDVDARVECLRAVVDARDWSYPLVLKPDQGERGAGVRWVEHEAAAREYLAREPRAVIAQVPHDGPFEAGLFYVRHPGKARGYVFSITDKRFPIVTGDGRSTLAELIHAHPRYRLQADTFLARHAHQAGRVPAAGEMVRLARAGNHAQGTEFRDGRALASPALEARIDDIARRIDGFYFGRFDVRYHDVEAFKEGRDFAIIELNGVTSEATHIYDPSGSLFAAWLTLMRQWSLAFAIGAANRARGHQPTSILQFAALVWAHRRPAAAHPIAD